MAGEDITVTIAGNASPLQEALKMGALSAQDFAAVMQQVMAKANESTVPLREGLQALTQQMQMARETSTYLAEATTALGATTAEANVAWLKSSADVGEYKLRLKLLQEQL